MKREQEQVREFMLKAGQECPEKPTIPQIPVMILRRSLIAEELEELNEAFSIGCGYDPEQAKVFIADAIADLLVVVLGTAVACGIDIDPIFQEVMRSNMTKFIDGHCREDGKWIKGPSYSPANIKPLLEAQSKAPTQPSPH